MPLRRIIVPGFILLLMICSAFSKAQSGYRFEFGGMMGTSNYLGEIGGGLKAARPFVFDAKIAKTRWSFSGYAKYKFHPKFFARASANYIRVTGDDALTANAGRRYRNLSFRNDMYDVEATIHWLMFSPDKPTGIYRRARTYLTIYSFLGIGVLYHNPKTLYQGQWVTLQPVRTEGVSYSRVVYCIPMGLGANVSISRSRRMAHRIGLEVNWRYTNSDYLDDVSTTYKSPSELPSALAYALSNRNPELLNQPDNMYKNYGWQGLDASGNPVNKAPRGNPNNKDSFFTVNITYGIAIKSRYTRSRGRKIQSVRF